jgi:hypothetical protein
MSTFHTTFSVVFHETGKTLSSTTPQDTPRKHGQFTSANETGTNMQHRTIAQHIFRYITLPFPSENRYVSEIISPAENRQFPASIIS